MNRDEILAKSRQEKKDEGMRDAENRGRRAGFAAFTVVFIIIIMINFINGRPNYGPLAMFWIYVSAEAYPKYCFTQRKAYLVSVIAGSLAAIFSLLNMLLTIYR